MRIRTISIAVASACSTMALALLAGCGERATDPIRPPSITARVPSRLIVDGAHGGSPRLYFLPPLVSPPTFSGTFDATAFGPQSLGQDEVYICKLIQNGCAGRLVTFSAGTGPGDVQLDPLTESYQVLWQTRDFLSGLDPEATYRIIVNVNRSFAGLADFVFVDNGAAKKQVDPSQYATVHLGSAIQIRFRLEQTAPPPPTGMIGVVAAGDYSCSLGASGQLFCWGDANFNAQNLALTPFPLSNGDQFSALGGANGVAGHSCAIRTLGTAACWGSNNWGELGNGAMGGVSTFPTNVNGPAFATISSGSTHSCGVTPGGDAYCWGDNVNGQLGDGTTSPRLTPVPVAGGLKFKSIAAGGFYTCGVTTAGAGYCWGNVLDGRLGSLNWSVPQTTPLAVAGGLTFASISTGFYHTCGVTTTGAAYCWGYGFSGQLGNGTTSSNQPVPSAVSGGISFSDISTGRDHTCGITTAGGAYCWGQNIDGRLGNSSTAVAVTTPTAVTGGLTLTRISAGADHTCGVTNAGSVYCWGANNSGQVGDGTQTQRLFPVIVTFP